MNLEYSISDVAWRPNSNQIAVGVEYESGTIVIVDSTTGQIKNTITIGTEQGYVIRSVSWSPDGSQLAVAANYCFCNIGNMVTSEPHPLPYPPDIVRVYNGTDYTVKGDLNPVSISGLIEAGEIKWSPDGKRIALPGQYNLQIFDAFTGSLIFTDDFDGHFIDAFAWSPDNKRILLGNEKDLLYTPQPSPNGNTTSGYSTLPTFGLTTINIP